MVVNMKELISAIRELGQPGCIDYIQMIATVISVGISGAALFYAIRVPKKIASEQNKIALFEKRFIALQKIETIMSEHKKIKDIMSVVIAPDNLRKHFICSIQDSIKHIAVIHDNTDKMFQYMFEQKICDKISFIHTAGEQLGENLSKFEALMRQQRYVSISEKDWYDIVSKDKDVIELHKEIIDICNKVLALEEIVSEEAKRCMDLRTS